MLKFTKLPKEYQEVEYIESNSIEYINTQIVPNFNTKIDIDFKLLEPTNQRSCILGSRLSPTAMFCLYINNTKLTTNYGNVDVGDNSRVYINTTDIFNVKNDSYRFYVNNTFESSISPDNYKEIPSTNQYPLYLFDNNSYGAPQQRPIKARVYKLKIYENDNLIAHFIPCYRKSDNEIGMYDIINNNFCTNQTTGTFSKGNDIYYNLKKITAKYNNEMNEVKYIKTKYNNQMVKVYDQLPSEYQRVEYIETNNNQYIDTGHIPNYNTKIKAKYCHTESSVDTPFFGVRNSNYSNSYTLWSHPVEYQNNTKGLGIFCDTSKYLDNYTLGTIIEIEYSSSGIKYGEQEYTWSPRNASPDYSLILFSLANGPYIDSRRFGGKLWYFKMWDDNVLIRDLVPCYRKADNEIGLYDLVNNVFYTNQGTGSFTKGNNI